MIFVLMYSYSSISLIAISVTGYMHDTTPWNRCCQTIYIFFNFLIAPLQCLNKNHKDWICCNQSHLLFHSWAWWGIVVLASRLLLDKDQLNKTWNIYFHIWWILDNYTGEVLADQTADKSPSSSRCYSLRFWKRFHLCWGMFLSYYFFSQASFCFYPFCLLVHYSIFRLWSLRILRNLEMKPQLRY